MRARSADDPGCRQDTPSDNQTSAAGEEMSPLFMDTVYEPKSPVSVSASESNTGGSEREGEGQHMGHRGRKRQDKNRDAARKSRRKQTERADELHEELQCLERSNSALKKEIVALKKDLHLYTTALENHKPFCSLEASASSSSSTARHSASPSADCQAGPSPPGVPPLPSSSTFTAAPSLSTSLTSSLGFQTRDCVESPHLSPSTPPTTTTLASPRSSSTELFTPSSSVTAPYSLSAVPHSLFSEDPPVITSRPTNVPPVCTGLVSNPVPSSLLTAAAQTQSGLGPIHESSSMSANACLPTLHSETLDAFLMKQVPFLPAHYSHSATENAGLVAQGCPMNVPQLNSGQFSRNPIHSSLPRSFLPPTLQDPALQSSFDSAFALKPFYSPQVTLNPASLLSLLTVPSPLNVPTSSSFDGPLSQPPTLLPPLGDTSRDLSLSELLEVNDWILSGNSHH